MLRSLRRLIDVRGFSASIVGASLRPVSLTAIHLRSRRSSFGGGMRGLVTFDDLSMSPPPTPPPPPPPPPPPTGPRPLRGQQPPHRRPVLCLWAVLSVVPCPTRPTALC